MSADSVSEVVRRKYAEIAAAVRAGRPASGCDPATGCERNPITADLYAPGEVRIVPEAALAASLGCGNPTALAELRAGEVVLDLGSGGGIDVLLSARRVGPTGKVYGLDMTDEMLTLARENQRRAGVENVEFLKGHIEQIPLPDDSVGVIISNCVINLSGNKDRVLAEAFRVLRPGGRLAVSDVVRRRDVSEAVKRSVELWIGCVAGALHEDEYRSKLTASGFEAIDVEPTRIYRADDAAGFIEHAGINLPPEELDGAFMSAFIRARKPGGSRRSI